MPWWRLPVYLRWILLLLLDEMFYQYQFNQADWWHNQLIYILTNILLGASLVAQLLKESACNAGDPGSTPGSRSFPGEGIGYLLQSSWTSLMAQTVKNLPAMWETWVQSLAERSPGGEHGNPLQYSCLENPHGQRSLVGYSTWGSRVRHIWLTKHLIFYSLDLSNRRLLKSQTITVDFPVSHFNCVRFCFMYLRLCYYIHTCWRWDLLGELASFSWLGTSLYLINHPCLKV